MKYFVSFVDSCEWFGEDTNFMDIIHLTPYFKTFYKMLCPQKIPLNVGKPIYIESFNKYNELKHLIKAWIPWPLSILPEGTRELKKVCDLKIQLK